MKKIQKFHTRSFIGFLALLYAMLLLTACDSTKAEDNDETVPATQTTAEEPVTEAPLPDGIINRRSTTVSMYDESANKEALRVDPGDSVGYRFSVNAPFDGMDVCCPSWSDDIGNLRFTLYAWNDSFVKTLTGTPLATELYEDFSDNAFLDFYFDEIPAGEYLLCLSDAVQSVGVWNFFSDVSEGYVYKGGIETDGEFQANIHFTMTPETAFNPCSSMIDLSKTVTTPPEVVYDDNHILNVRNAAPSSWDAVDALGRVLPTNEETGNLRDDRYVGLFYWTWHASHAASNAVYNVTEILKEHPEAAYDIQHEAWGPLGSPHFWDEPLFGYYSTIDRWVLRKHAELLADAGVDVVIFDNTNGTFTWRSSYLALLDVFAEARADGVKTPQIAFLLPFGPGDNTNVQLTNLYLDIYRDASYQDLWFYWEGKPLIMAYPDALDKTDHIQAEIADFFTFRPGQPLYTESYSHKDQWGWLSNYPQQVYYNEDGTPEQMTVGVAQNFSKKAGLTPMNNEGVFGRSYTSEGYDTREDAMLWGANFAEQCEYALEVDPEFVFITGWNEWVAGRHEEWQNVKNAFPDEYDDLNSRDIEPSAGALGDNYYYQMVSFIRRFKGTEPAPKASGVKTIDIHGALSQWDDVTPYYSYIGNTGDRDADGYVGTHYTNTSGRNDIVEAKVAHDAENLYFYVACANDITTSTDPNWMRLLLNTADTDDAAWETYEYMLNRETAGVLEKSLGGWKWEQVGDVDYTVSKAVLQVKIPRAMLGLEDDGFVLRFKWADNNLTENEQGEPDILDLYQNGDCAPGGRYQYRYTAER
ncbi:MAG: hypothetical protein J6I50_05020 [Clostridia bacterium]|nr:hypothetical protein [Clostridia bacterium]